MRLTLEDGSPYTSLTLKPQPGQYSVESTALSSGIAREADSKATPIFNSGGEPERILGELLFSEISVGRSTGSVSLRAVFSNHDGLLLPGMYVKATIEEGVLENAVLIPQSSALPNISGGHFVFLLERDESSGLFRIVRREIELDRALENHWIVKRGLSAGELLLLTRRLNKSTLCC